jgi:hypothetical protein
MNDASFPELTTLHTFARKADLTAEAKHITLYCLDQLPPLYADFSRTNEGRFSDAITSLARAVLKRLREAGGGEDADRVATALVKQLGMLHERVGLAPLRLPAAAARAPVRAKKKAV